MSKQDLIDMIINNMPDGLTQLEKARYIYIELGKQRRFDTRYYYGNTSTRRRIYREAQLARSNPRKLRNKRTIICVTLSEIYRSALEQVGIECEVVQNGTVGDKHVIPVVTLNDEIRGSMRIRADLQQDLEAIQTGMSTVEFGTINKYERNYDVINELELKRIDQKIGYIDEYYRDRDIDDARSEVREMNANESLRYILQNSKLFANSNFNGHVERRKYFRFLLDTIIPHYTDKKVFIFSCYREKENSEELESDSEKRDFTLCAYSYEKDDVNAYLYSEKEERFLPVSLEKLDELQDSGLVLGTRKKTKGVNLLKKFIMKNKRKKSVLENYNEQDREF